MNIRRRLWLNQHSSCTNKCLQVGTLLTPELRQYASRVPYPCGLMVVYEISPPLNLASQDISYTEWIDSKPTIQNSKTIILRFMYILNRFYELHENAYISPVPFQKFPVFSSPVQRTGRAITIPPA